VFVCVQNQIKSGREEEEEGEGYLEVLVVSNKRARDQIEIAILQTQAISSAKENTLSSDTHLDGTGREQRHSGDLIHQQIAAPVFKRQLGLHQNAREQAGKQRATTPPGRARDAANKKGSAQNDKTSVTMSYVVAWPSVLTLEVM
jgi:hypothetical protein